MTLSTGPWWWAPVFALGWMTTVPAQSFSAPARACVIAAARFIPGVCAVLVSSSLACTTRTPCKRHFAVFASLIGGLLDLLQAVTVEHVAHCDRELLDRAGKPRHRRAA